MRKKIHVTSHIIGVNGLKNAQALEFNSLTEATTTSPDAIYGCVKSTILVRLVVIAMSPIVASQTYIEEENQTIKKKKKKLMKVSQKVLKQFLL